MKPKVSANYTEVIQFRCSISKKKQLQHKAKKCNLSLSDFIRNSVSNAVIKTTPATVDMRFVQQLATVGNNLNQLLRSVDSDQSINAEHVNHALQALTEVLNSWSSYRDR